MEMLGHVVILLTLRNGHFCITCILLHGYATFWSSINQLIDIKLVFFSCHEKYSLNIYLQVFVETYVLISLRVELLGYVVTLLTLLRDCQSGFQRDCTIL